MITSARLFERPTSLRLGAALGRAPPAGPTSSEDTVAIDWAPEPGLWDDLADRAGAPLRQSRSFGDLSHHFRARCLRAAITCAGVPLAIAQIFLLRRFGLRFAWIPDGPLWLRAAPPALQIAALGRLAEGADRRADGQIHLAPPEPLPEAVVGRLGLEAAMGPAVTASLPLGDIDRLRAGLAGKWRNRLAAAERVEGLLLRRSADPGDLDAVLAEERAQQRRRGYRNVPAPLLRAWPAPARHLYRLERDRRRLAAALVLRHGTTATYALGLTGAEGRAVNAHNLLLWHAIRTLAAEGCTRLDLGQIDTERTPGLARFKLGTGADARRHGPVFLGTARRVAGAARAGLTTAPRAARPRASPGRGVPP